MSVLFSQTKNQPGVALTHFSQPKNQEPNTMQTYLVTVVSTFINEDTGVHEGAVIRQPWALVAPTMENAKAQAMLTTDIGDTNPNSVEVKIIPFY